MPLAYNGDLFRAYHSDVGPAPFVSVQDIDSGERKYLFISYKVEGDGRHLIVRSVSQDATARVLESHGWPSLRNARIWT